MLRTFHRASWLALALQATLVLGLLQSKAVAVDIARDQQARGIVIGPPSVNALRSLFEHPDQWRKSRAVTGAILVADHSLNSVSDEELRTWFSLMRQWKIPLELEVGAIKEWGPTAEQTFRAESPMWDRFQRLGASISAVAMDEPLTASREMLHKPTSYAEHETTIFVSLVRQKYKEVRVGDIEPYPSLPLQTHKHWLRELGQQLNSAGGRSLDFYRLDVDWFYMTIRHVGNWKEVRAIQRAANDENASFSLIYWAAGYPAAKAAGTATEETWNTEILDEASAFSKAGGKSDQIVVESWIQTPSISVPEESPISFTRSILDLADKLNLVPTESRKYPPR